MLVPKTSEFCFTAKLFEATWCTNTSPDNFSETTTVEEFRDKVTSIQEQQICFKQWKRVKCDDGKFRTKLLDVDQNKEEFMETAVCEFEVFKEHARKVTEQYQAFKQMKMSLAEKKDHVLVQMDFAENYGIKEWKRYKVRIGTKSQ
ncbi:hypothetical protein DPMN_001965 [Dreissena polymorpha]|uniref:Uncharacterized protein n=1 Tax=Dreissena polymorpha TaxID=45954 RepID=A0A9D4RTF8_DREPO|nr:hypothetical protein DPMN_001965 [Dreissena polymorpha]